LERGGDKKLKKEKKWSFNLWAVVLEEFPLGKANSGGKKGGDEDKVCEQTSKKKEVE
jgi:hypothetical protein